MRKIKCGIREDRAPDVAGWQLIVTAPKGRKIIGGYYNQMGNWRTVLACFYEKGTLDAGESLDEALVDEDGYAPAGWYEESETRDELLPITITHWQPLPEPPQGSARQLADAPPKIQPKGE